MLISSSQRLLQNLALICTLIFLFASIFPINIKPLRDWIWIPGSFAILSYLLSLLAKKECFLDLVQYLINHGADTNTQKRDGRTPLMEAARNGKTALSLATANHQKAIVAILKERLKDSE